MVIEQVVLVSSQHLLFAKTSLKLSCFMVRIVDEVDSTTLPLLYTDDPGCALPLIHKVPKPLQKTDYNVYLSTWLRLGVGLK